MAPAPPRRGGRGGELIFANSMIPDRLLSHFRETPGKEFYAALGLITGDAGGGVFIRFARHPCARLSCLQWLVCGHHRFLHGDCGLCARSMNGSSLVDRLRSTTERMRDKDVVSF